MYRMRCKHNRWLAAYLGVFLISVSCSGHSPDLAAIEYRLSIRPLDPNGSRVLEQLSIFAAVRDEDGFKDLAALHVLHDESAYIWTLLPETWIKKDQSKETWVGATGLSSPDSGPLPRGLYRVVLEDLSGDSDETSFIIGNGIEKGAVFPEIRIKNDLVSVSSKYSRTELLFLDSKESVVRIVEAPREATPLDRLYGSSDWKTTVHSLLTYAYDPERNLGIYSWIQTIIP